MMIDRSSPRLPTPSTALPLSRSPGTTNTTAARRTTLPRPCTAPLVVSRSPLQQLVYADRQLRVN